MLEVVNQEIMNQMYLNNSLLKYCDIIIVEKKEII